MSATVSDTSRRAELDTVASRAADECQSLAHAVDELQQEIGRWLETGALAPDADAIRRLQEADRLSQTLQCLARLISRLSPELAGSDIETSELKTAIGLDSVATRILAPRI